MKNESREAEIAEVMKCGIDHGSCLGDCTEILQSEVRRLEALVVEIRLQTGHAIDDLRSKRVAGIKDQCLVNDVLRRLEWVMSVLPRRAALLEKAAKEGA